MRAGAEERTRRLYRRAPAALRPPSPTAAAAPATSAAAATTTRNGARSSEQPRRDEHRGHAGVDDDRLPVAQRLHRHERGEQGDGEQVGDARRPRRLEPAAAG